MNKKQKALLFAQVFCAIVLVALRFIDQSTIASRTEDDILKHVFTLIYDYNVYVAIICGSVVAILPAYKDLYYPRKRTKEFRQGIDFKSVNIKARSAEAKTVKQYMELTHLRELETLRRIHRLARHFYGSILENRDGNPKGVLVIDSWQDESPFNEDVMKRLSYYLTLLSQTM